MLCDAHIHFIPQQISEHTSFYKGVWADKVQLYDFLKKNNIGHAFLVYPSTDAHITLGSFKEVCWSYNGVLEGIIKENKGIVAAAIVDVNDSKNISQTVKSIKDKGFKAITLASSFDGKFFGENVYPLFEAVEKNKLAVFIHPQTINPIGFERVNDPLLMPVVEYSFDISMCLGLFMMQGVFARFNINFIFSALGGVTPFLKDRFDRVYSMLRSREMVKDLGSTPSQILKKVYVDTSGASLKNIELAIELFGEDKILWGSDYPVNFPVGDNVAMLDALGQERKEKITSKNFMRLFGVKE
ncbi:MAG: amidohydrolase family protein [Candidatus Omnitrophota bacterium]|nr:amidohydrolase [Candidatus Omnitrophota bacterium]